MRSLHGFIVEPLNNQRYSHTKELSGQKVIKSVSKEDARNSNREGVVIETPVGYNGPVEKGDTLIVHHNVFKFYNDIQGREKNGRSFLKDNKFIVEDDQWFMYKKTGADWCARENCCFIEPVSVNDFWMIVPGIGFHLVGKVAYANTRLQEMGICKGDLVGFLPESEYEFDVDGKVLYRVFTNHICIKIDEN